MFIMIRFYLTRFFQHVTCDAVFVLFEQLTYQKVQLILDIPVMAFGICAIFLFQIFNFIVHFSLIENEQINENEWSSNKIEK